MKRFWAGFGLGVLSTIVVGIAAIIAFGMFFTGPMVIVSVQAPDIAEVGISFPVVLEISNPHSENVALDNIDVPDRNFEIFEIISITPGPIEGSPVGGFGTQTYYMELELKPGASERITLEVRAIEPGNHTLEFDVCNSYEDCSRVVSSIEVSGS